MVLAGCWTLWQWRCLAVLSSSRAGQRASNEVRGACVTVPWKR